jgi:hypothetical protein
MDVKGREVKVSFSSASAITVRDCVKDETPYLMGSSGLTLATGKNGGCRSGFVLIADVPDS